MHSYLRAIGFSKYPETEHDVDVLLEDLFHTYQERKAVRENGGRTAFLELTKSFGPDIGIKLCGQLDGNGFHRLWYYPYLNGSGVTSEGELTVQRKVNGQGYKAMCEEGRVGVSLIFDLQNPGDYKRETLMEQLVGRKVSTTLSALAKGGMILLPKKEDNRDAKVRMDVNRRHNDLVLEARSGSEEAIESLTLEDMDTYAMISRRIHEEDILTIVDSYVMPRGMECDEYQVLGTILFYTKVTNSLTDEVLYQMTLECNGMTFDVCINERDLFGDPEVGRRFKGDVWLQGRINFED